MEIDFLLQLGLLKVRLYVYNLKLGVTNEEIKENVDNIANNGFINYFGLQRFGCFNIMTHIIGKEAIKQNWKEVISNILI